MSEVVALFPLATVLYPGLLLPLNIFEPRYQRLVQDLLELPEAERCIGIIAIRQGRETGIDAVSDLYEVGCLARVRRIEPQGDGQIHVVTTGARRFRLTELLREGTPYLRGRVEWLDPRDDGDGTGDAAAGLLAPLVATFVAYLTALGNARQVEIELPDPPQDPLVLSYLVAATVVADLAVKQELLTAPDTATRMRKELRLLRREIALLERLGAPPAVELTRFPSSPN